MFGSFLNAAIGRMCQIGALILFFVLLVNHAPSIATLVVPVIFGVFGSYQIYLSRHTVRVRR